jgi:transcriptional regulator with GAF, ATPase, and Fis domain
VALARAGGNRSKAAAQLGLSRQGLLKMIARLGIETKSSG